ncbi:hypothetical protein ACV3UV_12230 [Clostridium perfringens]
MKLGSKPEALKINLNLKMGAKNILLIDELIDSANKIIGSFNYEVSYNRASMVRDIIEAAIISDVDVLKIEDRSFSIRELIERENPEMNNISNLMDVILDEETVDPKNDLKNFLFQITYDIICEMTSEVEDELKENEEELDNPEEIFSEFYSIVNSYLEKNGREFEEEEEESDKYDEPLDQFLCRAEGLDNFIAENDLLCDDFSKRFKNKIKYLPKYRQIKPLYFYDKFTYRKIVKQLKFLTEAWQRFLIDYSGIYQNKFTYSDFEKQIFKFIK